MLKDFFKSIYNFFKYKKEPVTKPVMVNTRYEIKTIAVIVGHTKKKPGTTTYKNESEYNYNKRVGKLLVENLSKLGYSTILEHRDVGGLRGAYSRANSVKPDMTIELHLNGFGRPAFGLEVLALSDDIRSLFYGDDLSDLVADSLGFKERRNFKLNNRNIDGVLMVNKKDNGYTNLTVARDYTTAGIRVLIEPTFVNFKTNESEKIIEDGGVKYAEVLARSIDLLNNRQEG